ncbi:MAG: V-type ATP synthase subunit A [Planctomycetes bacterium]|nr:V-type ATP synthase subunit A [Planctomycetota bacterium]
MTDDATHVAGEAAPARVVAVQDDLVTIEMAQSGGRPLTKNEVVFVCPPAKPGERTERLQGEVLRVHGRTAEAQVFENTRGVGIGDPVEQTGRLLSVELGPGLLGQIFDGLQNPLEGLAQLHGAFMPRGIALRAVDRDAEWAFTPKVAVGARVRAGAVLGVVQEKRLEHRILAPFDLDGEAEVTWIGQGRFRVESAIARLKPAGGDELPVTMLRRWPVRRPLPAGMVERGICERKYPERPMVTTMRLIDTFFPIARGGTGCIPGPFGAGKTVLQGLVARYADVDVVIVVACGERAGEVVETLTEFPKMTDPRGGGSLMDRTIVICNTSSMPVAAREASIYTGITLAEYYRQTGLDVLLLADSTSRWAQAMRETSGRLEEIPGEEAFPAYLDSSIKAVYERAGVIRNTAGQLGSLTMIGTVSPAGGNFEEPVTQSTLATVKCFLGLSSDRAYKRFYPAVDPLLSWSRYREQLAPWFEREVDPRWTKSVREVHDLLARGDAVERMMQVTGEEGITLEDFVVYQKARFIDLCYLQQDAFDAVDVSCPLERQKLAFGKMHELAARQLRFADKDEARDFFTRLSGLFRNFNYAADGTPDYTELLRKFDSELEARTAP